MCIYILFHVLFLYGLSQDIGYSSLYYMVGPYYLSIQYLIVFCTLVFYVILFYLASLCSLQNLSSLTRD